MPRYDDELDVWGNRRRPSSYGSWGEPHVPDLNRPHPSVLCGRNIQRDWCKRMQPYSTALALGLLATRIRARHGSFEDARAEWVLDALLAGTDPREEALAEMRQLMERDRALMGLLRPLLRWPPLRL